MNSETALKLQDKVAIITGAASGIGEAVARRYLDEGAKVVVVDVKDEGELAQRFTAIADRVLALRGDVTKREDIQRIVDSAVERFGGVDILFNNAGLALGRAPFDDSSEEDEARVFGTNVSGLVRMTRLCLPHFGDWGHIVNMGSVAGRQAYEGGATYIAAKFAERGFTYALREDLLGRPIRISTVDAGMVDTEFSLVRFKGDADKAAAVYKGIDPLTAEDIADSVMFALTRPWHMNVDEIVVKARNQASGGRILREP
jgi:NADP-dependent 3-hydroxy acid dehydrogenase YdfG